MKVLVTDAAGLIGSHLGMRPPERGDEVVGFDHISDCYDVNLQKARLARFKDHPDNTRKALGKPSGSVICDVKSIPAKDVVDGRL